MANNNFKVFGEKVDMKTTSTTFTEGDYIYKDDFNQLFWETTNTAKALIEFIQLPETAISDNIVTEITNALTSKIATPIATNASNIIALTTRVTTAESDIDSKVNKTTTIAGVDLQDNITKQELNTALGTVTDVVPHKTAINVDNSFIYINRSGNTVTLGNKGVQSINGKHGEISSIKLYMHRLKLKACPLRNGDASSATADLTAYINLLTADSSPYSTPYMLEEIDLEKWFVRGYMSGGGYLTNNIIISFTKTSKAGIGTDNVYQIDYLAGTNKQTLYLNLYDANVSSYYSDTVSPSIIANLTSVEPSY